MKNLSYPQVIHIKLWITFLFIFQKSLYKYLFMCYNIEKLRDNKHIEMEVNNMKIMVEYLRYFEEFGWEDFDTVEFNNIKDANNFYNNITSTDKRIWVGEDRIM